MHKLHLLYDWHVYPNPAIDTSVIRTAESDRSRRMPISALTTSVMESDRERGLAAGMDDAPTTPINPTELAAILARWAPRPVEAGRTR